MRNSWSYPQICVNVLLFFFVLQLEKIRVGHDGRGLGSGWFLEEIMIIVQEEAWVFLCHRWLADYEDDGKTERELFAGISIFSIFCPSLRALRWYAN